MSTGDGAQGGADEVAELRAALAKAEAARKESADSMAGILEQLKARSQRLIASETAMENMRDQLRAATRDAPGYLKQRVAQADTLRRQAENHARKLTSEVRDKGRELSALEGLVMRYQTEMNNLAMAAANVEADGEALVARVGQRGMVEVWENQRFYHVIGWSSNLLGTDRPALSDRLGTEERAKENARAPAGSEWLCDWQVAPLEGFPADVDGWTYGFDFPKLEDVSNCRSAADVDDCVRRRRWVRYHMPKDDESQNTVGRALIATTFKAHALQLENARLHRELAKLRAAAAARTSPRASHSRRKSGEAATAAASATTTAAGADADAAAAGAGSGAGAGATTAESAATSAPGGGDNSTPAVADAPTSAAAPAPAAVQPPAPPTADSAPGAADAASPTAGDTAAAPAPAASADANDATAVVPVAGRKKRGKGGKKRRSQRRVAAIEEDDL